jgi:hypothetical protein
LRLLTVCVFIYLFQKKAKKRLLRKSREGPKMNLSGTNHTDTTHGKPIVSKFF